MEFILDQEEFNIKLRQNLDVRMGNYQAWN